MAYFRRRIMPAGIVSTACQLCGKSFPALLAQMEHRTSLYSSFFELVDRIHEAYILGEHYGTVAFTGRVYESHRRVSLCLPVIEA
jgi:hypothetical protein